MSSKVEDWIALRDLVDRYTIGVHDRSAKDIAACFGSDGVWKVGSPFDVEISGAQNIAEAIIAMLAPMELIVQMNHSVLIDIAGDRASIRCVVQEMSRNRGGETGMVMLGNYSDVAVRSEGSWKFLQREFSPILIDQNPPGGTMVVSHGVV